MSFHVMTHIVGVVIVLCSLTLFALCVHTYRALRAHAAAEAAAFQARGASAFSIVALGMTLPMLLRAAALACCIAGAFCGCTGLVTGWLHVDPVRDSGLRAASPFANPGELGFTPAGQLCMASAKLGPSSYAVTKTFSYLFFFLKSRTVRPTEKMSWVHKGVLFLTMQLFLFAASAVWLVNGDVNPLDGVCAFNIPLWMTLLMASADFGFSCIYLALFVHPLWETIQANRAFRRRNSGGANQAWNGAAAAGVSPTNAVTAARDRVNSCSSPADMTLAQSQVALASARGSALERVLRRNMQSCALSIASTLAVLGLVVVAHVTDNPYLRKADWMMGVWDVTVANLCIAHLMHSKEPSTAAAAGAQVHPTTAAAVCAATSAHKYKDPAAPPQSHHVPSPKHNVAIAVQLVESTQHRDRRAPASGQLRTPQGSFGLPNQTQPSADAQQE